MDLRLLVGVGGVLSVGYELGVARAPEGNIEECRTTGVTRGVDDGFGEVHSGQRFVFESSKRPRPPTLRW